MALVSGPNHKLRQVRESLGLTQAEMAAACNMGLRTYQLWESGKIRAPRDGTLTGLYQLTGKDRREDFGFHAQPLSPIKVPSSDQLIRAVAAALRGHPPAAVGTLIASGQARLVGRTEHDRIRTRESLLSGMYDQWGGAAVERGALVDAMQHATRYLNARFIGDRARSSMRAAIAELSLTVATMLADHADFATAQTMLLIGLTAARDAREDRGVLRGRILAQLIRQTLGRRDVQTAQGLLDLADTVAEAESMPADVRGLFTALRAGATGTLGQLAKTHVLADKSLDLYAAATSRVIDRGEVTYEAGFGLACLELCAGLDVDNATIVLEQAISAFTPSQIRQRTHARTFRLLTLTERGDTANALHDVTELCTDVDSLRSAQIRESLALTHLVPRVVRGDAAAARVSSALHAYPAPVPPDFLRSRPSPVEVAAALHVVV